MNLIDLVARKDPALLQVPEGVEHVIHGPSGRRMHALRLPAGGRLVLADLSCFQELVQPPKDLGWFVARASGGRGPGGELRLTCSCRDDAGRVEQLARQVVPAHVAEWVPLAFTWQPILRRSPALRLEIDVEGGEGELLALGIAEAIDLRRPLYDLALGKGVEIGPGCNPQILPKPGVDVRYLERSPLEEWATWYQKANVADVDPRLKALWERYIIGDAQKLDTIPSQSLDFIFSSHVFEHMVNPLGTLETWRSRLRPGGYVLAVVPDAHNCFDWRKPLSLEAEWMEEWQERTWSYQMRHYEKWCRYAAGKGVTVESLRARGYSIHAHYYTPQTFGRLLELSVDRLGFRRFELLSAQNRKDFSWILEA